MQGAVIGQVTRLGVDRLRGVFAWTAFAAGATAYVSFVLRIVLAPWTTSLLSLLACGAAVAALAGFFWSGMERKVKRMISLDARGLDLAGVRHVPYAYIRGILPNESFREVRVTTVDETFVLSFHGEDPARVAHFARALHARMTPRVWEIESTRPSPAAGAVALLGAAVLAFGAASGPVPAFLFPFGVALFMLAAYFFMSGPLERLRIGEDGVELARHGRTRARLSMRGGLTVAARANEVVFSAGNRALSLHLPSDMASTLAAQVADASARQRDPEAMVEVPPLERGAARVWLERVKTLQGSRYRGRVETPEDLRAIVLDGTRSAAERVYAALRIRSLGGESGLIEVARDTTVSPRLRISLDAALTGDDARLAAELEVLGEEEAVAAASGQRLGS